MSWATSSFVEPESCSFTELRPRFSQAAVRAVSARVGSLPASPERTIAGGYGKPFQGAHLQQRHENNGDQAARPISTGQLHALQRFHPRPINVVVYDGPLGGLRLGIPDLEVSFPLRCFQRLSVPDIATRRCHWHDNRITSGPSTRVLSYYGQGLARILRLRQIGTELSHDVLNPARVPL